MLSKKDLEYIVTHIFLPLKLPQHEDTTTQNEHILAQLVHNYAKDYIQDLPIGKPSAWRTVLGMLGRFTSLQATHAYSTQDIIRAIDAMRPGDVTPMFIRQQNAGLIIRKLPESTRFESFEVSAKNEDILSATGKLIRTFPGPAISVPNSTANDPLFVKEVASFISLMNTEVLDSAATSRKAGVEVVEKRNTADPRYITTLLTGILRGMGEPADIKRIHKRMADDVLWLDCKAPWRRSPLWTMIRVALQTSLAQFDHTRPHLEYKVFVLSLMVYILDIAVTGHLSSDFLHCMRTKVARRLHKLDSDAPNDVSSRALEVLKRTSTELQQRWATIQESHPRPLWDPKTLNIYEDSFLTLPNSSFYLRNALEGLTSAKKPSDFAPNQHPRHLRTADLQSIDPDVARQSFNVDVPLSLYDFERTVRDNVDTWVSSYSHQDWAIERLSTLLQVYHKAASKYYKPNSEDISIMFLTLFDIWIAIDKLAIIRCSLLQEYAPEFSISVLEPLLLRKSEYLARCKSIASHIGTRHQKSRANLPSIFASTPSSLSFSVRFFNTSTNLQALKTRIESKAASDRSARESQLQTLVLQQRELSSSAASLDHAYTSTWKHVKKKKNCPKCRLEQRINNMEIAVFEWPLPSDHTLSSTVVFELDCPPFFRIWRDTTYLLLSLLSTPHAKQKTPKIQISLPTYTGLKQYQGNFSRITIASHTKSFYNTHYKLPAVGAAEISKVCLPNGLQFSLCDSSENTWARALFSFDVLPKVCVLKLHDSVYSSLQFAVDGTTHTPNRLLATQSSCPRDISLHEFDAFVGLRSGSRVQWLNILRELRSRSLTFRNEAVHVLHAQAAWQVGPLSKDGAPEAHSYDLVLPQFSTALLDELDRLQLDISTNWLEMSTANIIIALTCRLLASSSMGKVATRCILLLRKTRNMVIKWVHELVQRLEEATEDNQIDDIRLKVCEAAATCRATFDVDERFLDLVLRDAADVAIALECSIRLHDNMLKADRALPFGAVHLFNRDKRLTWSLEPKVHSLLASSGDGMDKAISTIWPIYKPGTKWRRLRSPNEQWFSSTSFAENGQAKQVIHLDVISGSLLIDGLPIGRLSDDILQHPTYVRLFQGKSLDVVPANMDGMQYASKSAFGGYQLFFAMNGQNLVIRAVSGCQVLELIPQHVFQGDLPAAFVDDYFHWLSISSGSTHGSIELRPKSRPWSSSDSNWTIHISLRNGRSQMRKRDTLLLDIHSPSAFMVSNQLEALDSKAYLHLTCPDSYDTTTLYALLPRYRLSFVLDDEAHLESTQFSGMIVDPSPNIGSLVGLVNQLCIRPKNTVLAQLHRVRRVLIPEGTVTTSRTDDHVRVQILPPEASSLSYHEYLLDNDLGCLIGKPNWFGRLYQAKLHALTSYCLPDPLTGRTGVEEALSILQSGFASSFPRLSDREIQLLVDIDSISPRLTYYPAHLRTMQSIEWSNTLSPFSQCPTFSEIVRKIHSHAEDLDLFYADQPSKRTQSPFRHSSDPHLLQRYYQRYRILYHADMLASVPVHCDVSYSRVLDEDSLDSERKACILSKAITDWRPSPYPRVSLSQTLLAHTQISTSSQPINDCHDWLRLSLQDSWFRLYDTCRKSDPTDRFRLAFGLNIFNYQSPQHWDIAPIFLNFATNHQFRSTHPPRFMDGSGVLNLSAGFEPQVSKIVDLINQAYARLPIPLQLQVPRQSYENDREFHLRRSRLEETMYSSQAEKLASNLKAQWPCDAPSPPHPPPGSAMLFSQSDFMPSIQSAYSVVFRNHQFRTHLEILQELLTHSQHGSLPTSSPYSLPPPFTLEPHPYTRIQLQALLDSSVPSSSIPELPSVFGHGGLPTRNAAEALPSLNSIICDLSNSECHIHRVYAETLISSRDLFITQNHGLPLARESSPATHLSLVLEEHHRLCKSTFKHILQDIIGSLSVTTRASLGLKQAGQWPRLTPMSLVCLLASTSHIRLQPTWMDAFVSMCQAFIIYQRSSRLLALVLLGSYDELALEISNTCVTSGDRPDWLLIQIESNFTARHLQLEVAEAMIHPPSNRKHPENTILQLNMGEGKSSVIVPFVSTEVANGLALCRVVIIKPLVGQMFRQLTEKLGGLVNRRIFFVPFSRELPMDSRRIEVLRSLFRQCRDEKGILLMQPEHILSFKLMVVERLINASRADYLSALHCIRWMDSVSRDLLDESDEILETRYQLIYTMGQQVTLEDHPNRWITIQQIFHLVKEGLRRTRIGIEADFHADYGRFPFIQHVEPEAGAQLIDSVVQLVISGALPGLAFGVLSKELQELVLLFITRYEAADLSEQVRAQTGGFWTGILLLRGLFAKGILLYALRERRWRVDYGLDPKRTLLAVPYRAKDVPSLRAEFGHPDLSICLTCLSYYYTGLSEQQLRQSFELLFILDDPDAEYATWTDPNDPRDLRSINVENTDQWANVMCSFQYNKATIDFFLRSIVFPKEGKTFPRKLSTSGWDLAETRTHVTTGFSGTNDNRYLLPTTAMQHDIEALKSTNAKVLSYMLLPENDYYLCAQSPDGRGLRTINFLELLSKQEPAIRVLLDVGAQMLELQNVQLAHHWLNLLPIDVEAAVYFNQDDEIMVLTRDGDSRSFHESPYSNQLDRCAVYLDDAHTRGTDLKLPIGTRAAVTLGPKVTKDRLIQGCMRMRKLGVGHTLMFFAPPQVDESIRRIADRMSPDTPLRSVDVIRWAIHETCSRIEHNIHHWYSQGIDYNNRRRAWDAFLQDDDTEGLRSAWLQPEGLTLEQLYGGTGVDFAGPMLPTPAMQMHLQSIGIELGPSSIRSVDEEQEREVSHEVELEREVQRPKGETPVAHALHPSVQRLIQSGILDTSDGFLSLIKFFRPSDSQFMLRGTATKLFATHDFMMTVKSSRKSAHHPSDYLRPIKWIVTHKLSGSLIIMSPWEVNELLPLIHKSPYVTLHIYSPRVTVSMLPFDDLKVYTVPALPYSWTAPRLETTCINLIAGQLYLRDYDEYLYVCAFLGRYSGDGDNETRKGVDGFIKPGDQSTEVTQVCGFTTSPIQPLKQLVSARRKGMDYRSSHLGKILNSAVVRREDFS